MSSGFIGDSQSSKVRRGAIGEKLKQAIRSQARAYKDAEQAVDTRRPKFCASLTGVLLGLIFALSTQEGSMKAYIVITTKAGAARGIAEAMSQLPGVKMADACWGTGDVYSVVEFQAWKDLNTLVIDKLQVMPGVERTETHVAVES